MNELTVTVAPEVALTVTVGTQGPEGNVTAPVVALVADAALSEANAAGSAAAAAASANIARGETVVDLGNIATAQVIDLSLGTTFKAAAVDVCDWTFANPQAGFTSISLILYNGSWIGQNFVGVKWASGFPPSLSVAGTDILEFMSPDNWVTIYGFLAARNIK
jgi:hypothetical protein